jgi:spermidine/putrescine transport system substrate-binding protein
MRKLFLLATLLVLAMGTVALAQDTAATEAVEIEPWTCPEGFEGQELNVYNWSTYIAEDTMDNFKELCGITYTYDTFGSGDELVSRLRQGNPGYDIAVPPNADIPKLAAEGLLEELDLSLIPNFANLSPDLIDAPYDPGNKYSIPYQWGTIGIGYNKTVVGEEITSWEQFFNYDGPVAWLEDKRPMLGFALVILGYDPNTTNEDEIFEAADWLVDHGDNVVTIAEDDGQEFLVRGEVDMVIEYSGDIYQIMLSCECDDYAYVLPEEGADLWVDNVVIPTGADNIPLAHVFIDYILHPQVAADISNYIAYLSPNQAAIDAGLIDPIFTELPGFYPDAETMSRLFFLADNLDIQQVYNDAWDNVKIGIGQ